MADDSNRSKSSIPSWQQTQPSFTSTLESQTAKSSSEEESIVEKRPADESGEQLLEQAEKFLQDPAIRDASLERKRAFLASKGIDSDEINQLLGQAVTNNGGTGDADTDVKAIKDGWSNIKSPTEAKQSLPPIVTYPEFLTQTTKPPPLVTTSRLLSTFYIASALSATFYGISKYIVAPMTESLTTARHDLTEHVTSKLEDFNERLRKLASEDPREHPDKARKGLLHISNFAIDDDESVHSDPTELFHRDFGTQTSPYLSRRGSTVSRSSEDQTEISSLTTSHESRLRILISHLNELATDADANKVSSDSLNQHVREFSQYLSEMRYQSPYQFTNGFATKGPGSLKNDATEQFRTDIRSVKGVLLSARNFPAGNGGARIPGRFG